jgi:lipid-binding SYLF domain-containing protein
VARCNGVWSLAARWLVGASFPADRRGSIGISSAVRTTVVLVLMNDSTLLSVIDGGLTLGTDTSIAAGTIGDSGKATAASTSADIVQFVNVGGVFAGMSLDGAVVHARDGFNRRYYGPDATTYDIVIRRSHDAPGADMIRQALEPRR